MSDTPEIRRHVLDDGKSSVAILSLGCITQDWQVALNGTRIPVVLGYRDARDYLQNPCWLGAIAGRVANRISGAAFSLAGQRFELPANEPPNHLHGGPGGLHAQNWAMEPDGNRAVQLHLVSPHDQQGYPGRVELTITISLRDQVLSYDMLATTDRPTPINLAQHSYYNLMGRGEVFDHRLQVQADRFTPVGAAMLPTGQIETLRGKALDLRQERTMAAVDPDHRGLDMNFVLSDAKDGPAATLNAPNGLRLTMTTDQPCLQLYTGTHLKRTAAPLADQSHVPFSGLCLEPQQFPNALNTPGFPSIIATPDHPYRQRLSVRIAQECDA